MRYWRAVEYFSPPKVEAVDPNNDVRAVSKGRPLPWEAGVLATPRKERIWRHTVYAGIFETRKVREVLQEALRAPESEHDLDGRVKGTSALLSFGVDEAGHLIKESITLSSCAWAVSRTLTPGPDDDAWLDGFDDDQEKLLGYLFEIGDGRIPVSSTSEAAGRGLGLVAGTAARVALDVATGGISALPSVVGTIAAPTVGPIAAKVIEKIGDSLAKDANDTINATVKPKLSRNGKDTEPESPEGDDSSAPTGLGTKVLTVDDLAAITRWVAETLGLAEALEPRNIRVKSRQIPLRTADDAAGDEFLNSFYAPDLELVAVSLAAGDAGKALTDYLRDDESIDMAQRVDLRRSPATVLRTLAPDAMPLGRWPSPPTEPLALSQQFAINEIFNSLADPAARGLYAVNGPPGTGKTTMLRDLIAAIVVARATRLARLKSASEVFQKTPLAWTTEETVKKYHRKLHPLRADLTGFEIVVASSNNGAVENITLEVPASKTIDLETFPDADYWAGPATILTGTSCWGAVAARLGRRSFRQDFVDRFWWGTDKRSKNREEPSEMVGLHQILMDLEHSVSVESDSNLPTWNEAVDRFNAAIESVKQLAQQRQRIADILIRESESDPRLIALRNDAQGQHDYVARLRQYRDELQRLADNTQAERRRAEAELSNALEARDAAANGVACANTKVQFASAQLNTHLAGKPGRLRRFWSRNALDEWNKEASPFKEALAIADAALSSAEAHFDAAEAALTARRRTLSTKIQTERQYCQQLSQCDRNIERSTENARSADRAVSDREARLRRDADLLDEARRRWPRSVPGAEWTADPDDRGAMEYRETSSPWMDAEFADARSRAFLAALDLHRAALTTQPALARRNLLAAMDVVSGAAPSDMRPAIKLAAWQMIFFVVPVISTTFASMSRMFTSLGRESLGWLFIDEAGQAAPQAAVGALWRSQRAVMVGDPLQLEPVVNLPWSGQKRLCRHFGVDPQWTPQNTSVQSLADRINRFGTWIPNTGDAGYTWVGSPLRVHRRCDRLMFEVSNEIAYDGLMVYGVTERKPFELLTQNTWLDVGARPSGSKWNPLEGRYVDATLNRIVERISRQMDHELADAGLKLPDWAVDDTERADELARRLASAVFIVSPFRDIAQTLQKSVAKRFPKGADRVGTVHTTQGKEADIVILVLGTAADQDGSRTWAAKTPNLLNVAVTRARRRLVVVGDFQKWSHHRNFHVLAQHGKRGTGGLLTVIDTSKEWRLR